LAFIIENYLEINIEKKFSDHSKKSIFITLIFFVLLIGMADKGVRFSDVSTGFAHFTLFVLKNRGGNQKFGCRLKTLLVHD